MKRSALTLCLVILSTSTLCGMDQSYQSCITIIATHESRKFLNNAKTIPEKMKDFIRTTERFDIVELLMVKKENGLYLFKLQQTVYNPETLCQNDRIMCETILSFERDLDLMRRALGVDPVARSIKINKVSFSLLLEIDAERRSRRAHASAQNYKTLLNSTIKKD